MSLETCTTTPKMSTLSLHFSPSPAPHAAKRSSFDVIKAMKNVPGTQICVLSSPEGYSAKLRFPLTSLCPFTNWSWDRFGHPYCARTLRVSVPKDPVRTIVFTPVCWTGLGPEYCCLEETLFSAKLDSVFGLFVTGTFH